MDAGLAIGTGNLFYFILLRPQIQQQFLKDLLQNQPLHRLPIFEILF